jgi:hypothetical protein
LGDLFDLGFGVGWLGFGEVEGGDLERVEEQAVRVPAAMRAMTWPRANWMAARSSGMGRVKYSGWVCWGGADAGRVVWWK